MRYLECSLFTILLLLVGGLPRVVSAQNTGPPEAVVKLANDIKLGVQAYGGVEHRNQTILPLQRQSLTYIQRPVSGDLSYSILYGGVGASLRIRGAEIGVSIQRDMDRKDWIQFRSGGNAFPYSFSSGASTLHAEYLAFGWIGVGVLYRRRDLWLDTGGLSFRLNGETVDPDVLFGGRQEWTTYAIYAPFRVEWNGVQFYGRAGLSVWGTGSESYTTGFLAYQSPSNPGRMTLEGVETPPALDPKGGESVRAQFGRVGAAVPVWGTMIRAGVGVSRTHVPDLSTTWSYDARLEVGLPF
ncbi:MAG: hypothetical protein ABEL51_02660 [Salinibacter sp.]